MNANELADWIDERNISSSSQTLGKAATMLRQQQAEIEALKAHPVKEQLKEVELKATFNRGYKEGARDYASKCNPAELTDEEIADFLYAYCLDMGNVYEASEEQFIKCVRAILRKAQEK